jgi:hypothetical protein
MGEGGMEVATGVNPNAVGYALGQINDGMVFERFAKAFLSAVLGYEFVPVGGIRDEATDALEHAFEASGVKKTIFQMSIEADSRAKIRRTLKSLKAREVVFQRLIYVTNRKVMSGTRLIEDMFNEFNKPVNVWDIEWFKANVNESVATVRAFNVFAETYLHEFSQPGKSYEVADLEGDPRLYVFLRQLFDEERENLPVEDILADALILYALEGTDPDKGIVMTRDEILQRMASMVRFDFRRLHDTADRRLAVLSGRPRKITWHTKLGGYCLPYETRSVIQERNLDDVVLYEEFKASAGERSRAYCEELGVDGEYDAYPLVEQVLRQVFRKQGLEFADFVLTGDSSAAVEQSLPEIVANVVDFAAVNPRVRVGLKTALLLTVREMVYRGTETEGRFLARLARTYTMLFLLQCDPKLVTAFAAMMSKLRIYVCTSVLIPAMSEFFLEKGNQRYGDLLRRATASGAELRVNEPIINELAAHLRMIKKTYEEDYRGSEGVYDEEVQILYVPEMLIRAYFYSRLDGRTSRFEEFLEAFVSPHMTMVEENLIAWLGEEYGVRYVSDASLEVDLSQEELEAVQRELEAAKGIKAKAGASIKAMTDARLVLTVRGLRMKNNEAGTGILGYETWWLSMDTSTEKAARRALGLRYGASCCMRVDFLNQFVSLAPSKTEVDEVFKEAFPGLVGVSLSYHLDPAVIEMTRRLVRDHAGKSPARVKAILRELMDKVKSEPTFAEVKGIRLFLDEKRAELEGRSGAPGHGC